MKTYDRARMHRALDAVMDSTLELPKVFQDYGRVSDKAARELKAKAFAYAEECRKAGKDVKVTVRWSTFTAPHIGVVTTPVYTVKLR